MDQQLAQAAILEIFDMETPAITRIPPSCSTLASSVFSNFAMDTSDLHTEETTCTFRTTASRKKRPTHSILPSSYSLIVNDPGRSNQPYSRPKVSRNTNITSLRSDVELSSIKTTVEDENIRKLNKLRDYYKSQIKELPPLHQTAAAIISNISSRAAGAANNPSFHYHNTIDISEKTAPKSSGSRGQDIFKPKFNSTVNYDKGQIKCPNLMSECDASNEKSQLSWRDYVSGETQSKKLSRTYTVDNRKRSSRSNKSLQTMLTMENVSKLSEMLVKVNGKETYRVDNNIDRSEAFRLTKSVAMVPSSFSNTYGTAEGCPKGCSVSLTNYDMNVRQLTGGMRTRVINWLFRLDEDTGGNVVTLQCAVRFLDELAALYEGMLPDSVLTCGVACYWVASKLQSARVPGAAAIARQCGGVFTPQQLVACERRVLAKLAFPSAPVVPANEVERLAHLWDVHEESGVTAVAHHMCCCALLHSHLAAVTSVQLAGAALATALQHRQPQHPLLPHLPLLRSDEDGWSVALEQELERVCECTDGAGGACLPRATPTHIKHSHCTQVEGLDDVSSIQHTY